MSPLGRGLALASPSARAAELAPADQADLRRAVAMVALSSSEEPAMRQERQAREPSPAFQLGAALAAWINAAAQLDFDLKNPTALGPPHAHLGAPEDDFLLQECKDEATAFVRLEARSRALGLKPRQVAALAGPKAEGAQPAWLARRAGPASACRELR